MNIKKKILLAGLFTAATSSAAFAAYYPSHYVEKEYYSDAAKTQYSGSLIQTCSGRYHSYGKITEYYTVEIKVPCHRNGDF